MYFGFPLSVIAFFLLYGSNDGQHQVLVCTVALVLHFYKLKLKNYIRTSSWQLPMCIFLLQHAASDSDPRILFLSWLKVYLVFVSFPEKYPKSWKVVTINFSARADSVYQAPRKKRRMGTRLGPIVCAQTQLWGQLAMY